MSEFLEFPKWKYHAKNDAVIVDDADAEKALGRGWRDVPFDTDEAPAGDAA